VLARKDDRAMSRCGDMAIRNYPRWRPAANLVWCNQK